MVFLNQDLPLTLWFAISGCLSGSALLDDCTAGGLAIRERAGITGIPEHLKKPSAARQCPDNFVACSSGLHLRNRNMLFAEPDGCLPCTPELAELLKHARDRLLNLPVRCLFNAVLLIADESDRQFPQCEPALDLLLESFASALPYEIQLELRYSAF